MLPLSKPVNIDHNLVGAERNLLVGNISSGLRRTRMSRMDDAGAKNASQNTNAE